LWFVIRLINKFYIFQIFFEIFSFVFFFQNVLMYDSSFIFRFLIVEFFSFVDEIDSIEEICNVWEIKIIDWFKSVVFEILSMTDEKNDDLIDINILVDLCSVMFSFNFCAIILFVDEYVSVVSFLDSCFIDSMISILRVLLLELIDRLFILLSDFDLSFTLCEDWNCSFVLLLFSNFLFFLTNFLISKKNLLNLFQIFSFMSSSLFWVIVLDTNSSFIRFNWSNHCSSWFIFFQFHCLLWSHFIFLFLTIFDTW
jgi:hypothetical protein